MPRLGGVNATEQGFAQPLTGSPVPAACPLPLLLPPLLPPGSLLPSVMDHTVPVNQPRACRPSSRTPSTPAMPQGCGEQVTADGLGCGLGDTELLSRGGGGTCGCGRPPVWVTVPPVACPFPASLTHRWQLFSIPWSGGQSFLND